MAVVNSDPEILGGKPVFPGTRVPVETLLTYIEHDKTLLDFLDDFPSVTHPAAMDFLRAAKDSLLDRELGLKTA
jgi:uncharacterized protein (DUF433 family)